jgi:hypothetical protein
MAGNVIIRKLITYVYICACSVAMNGNTSLFLGMLLARVWWSMTRLLHGVLRTQVLVLEGLGQTVRQSYWSGHAGQRRWQTKQTRAICGWQHACRSVGFILFILFSTGTEFVTSNAASGSSLAWRCAFAGVSSRPTGQWL